MRSESGSPPPRTPRGETLASNRLRYGCSKLGQGTSLHLACATMFYLQNGTFCRADERTRTAYPCSSYEFACVRSSPYWCVRLLRLFRRFSTIWQSHFVHCVPVRISPVAVRVAVNAW